MDHDRLARALRAPSAGPVTRRTPIAIAVGLALAGGMPAAQAGAPAPGAALGNEFQVNTQISSFQRQSAAAMDAAGDFVVTWTDYGGEDGDSSGIFAQRYHADGTPAGTEFRVNTHTSGGQARPAVAMDAAGNFVVTWTDYSAEDGDSFGVFGQHYHADGTPDGAEFKVNTQTAGKQHRPAVAMDGAGDFVVTWMGDDGSAYGVFAQRYRADGTPDGTEFLVNTNTVNSQREAAVAMDAAGDFVVSWTDHSGEDGDAFGIFAQRFHADGTPNGAEFQVNTHFAGDQDVSTVAMDA
ncbi:MAG TPA: hypothetical protein VFL54_08715, partial [Gammaproteobacteria bacterium]|nr:hypothetical protein [Gammaproteobacteria bacterium]